MRIEAHYDDAWRKPLAPQPLMVHYLDGGVIDGSGETRSVMSFGTQDGEVSDSIRPDLGSHMAVAPRDGTICDRIQNGMGAWLSGEGAFWASVGEWIANIPDMLGDAWDNVSDHFKRLWDNREQILRLIEQLAHGLVNEFEQGLAALADVINSILGLEEIGGILSDPVERSAHWAQAMIELATRTTVLRNLTAAVLSVVMIIPPTFYAEMVSTDVGLNRPGFAGD